MSAKILTATQIEIGGITIKLLRKRIRSLNLRIVPPHGEVRVSAPWLMNEKEISDFISSKILWVAEKQKLIRGRKYPEKPKFLEGETHDFFGEKFALQIVENTKRKNAVHLVKTGSNVIELHIKNSSTIKTRRKILEDFYRAELKKIIPHFIAIYEKKMNVKVAEFGIKKMRTRWGTCNRKARRIWINLELAKKPLQCLEYLIVHEMTHLLERGHNKRFYALMDRFMPNWQEQKNLMKSL